MGFFEVVFIGVGLSMDAFAVSICKGLSTRKLSVKHALICGLWFGIFQALMPTIGYILGVQFADKIESIDHWIAFILLALIGLNMIKEALEDEDEDIEPDFSFKAMLPLAVATSIDALAVGVTFAFLNVNIISSVLIIGCTTFVISIVGVVIGHIFGTRYKARAEIVGGVILILIGLKILLEHLGIVVF
ncbi:MAG: manganese efflux pump MntP family protein [Erysipelotrichaceae bacterium]|nr:manganese efflux pump MntP family protein [Erysipelotrichaceae bacterium]